VQFQLFEKLLSTNLFREKPYDYLLININMEEVLEGSGGSAGSAGRSFFKPFFSHLRKLFSKSLHKIFVIILPDIIG